MKERRRFNHIIKVCFDYIAVILFSPLWLFLLLCVSVVIKIYEPDLSVFFIQKRVGRDGRLFNMIKFRTMHSNPGYNTVTAANDRRITPLGKVLRKWKIDELPELINVLRGEMSLVGPRPDVPGYADRLVGESRIILKLKPGITGPASLKYANEEELLAVVDDPQWYNDHVIFPDKVHINIHYYYNYTIWTDINLIFKTLIKS